MITLKNKTKNIRHLGEVDISSIKPLILALPQTMWTIETQKRANDFECFHHTEHILFKFHSLGSHKNYIEYPLWKFWEAKFLPIIKAAIKPYGYQNGVIPKVMLAKLLKGHQIDAHIDYGTRNWNCHKIHIPIQTAESVLFEVDNKKYHLAEGNVYEVNNVVRHAVYNPSNIDRIHLIFEYYDDND
jgi:hypothetical protein